MSQQNKELKNAIGDGAPDVDRKAAGGPVLNTRDPLLQPPKDPDVKRKSTWKRKLIGWSVVLLVIGTGVGAFYFLVRAQLVNVTVNADSRRSTQSTKPKSEVTNSDSVLTGDAINIARKAAGADTNSQPANSTPGPSPSPSPLSADPTQNRKIDFTGNSPVLGNLGKSDEEDSNSQKNEGSSPAKTDGSGIQPQSRANPTQSLFVDDPVPKSTPVPISVQTQRESKPAEPVVTKQSPPTVPPFGTLLPVRTQGVIFTLRNNSYARLELIRDVAGNGWSLAKGTVLIGRTTGSEETRAFVNVFGYIDPHENKLVSVTGEVLGSDGANGIPGKRIAVDRNTFKQTLRKVATGGLQVAGTMAGALTGRGTVVIDSVGYRLMDPLSDQARSLATDSKNTFVKVEAGQQAWVMVTDLPGRVDGADAPGTEPSRLAGTSLTDREVMELILFGTDEEIRTAMPLMTDEQKRLAIKSRSQESHRP